MPRFMLDTDTCSFILKRSNEVVLGRLQTVPINDVCISVITKAELLLGVELSHAGIKTALRSTPFSGMSRCSTCPTKRRCIMPRSGPS